MLICQCQVMYKKHFKSSRINDKNHPNFHHLLQLHTSNIKKRKRQYAPTIYSSSLLPPDKITRVQKIVGSLLYYDKAKDNILLPALNKFLQNKLLLQNKQNINVIGSLTTLICNQNFLWNFTNLTYSSPLIHMLSNWWNHKLVAGLHDSSN